MCGIAGIINFDRSPIEIGGLKAMTDSLRHRGPDDEGYYLFGDSGGFLLKNRLEMSGFHDKFPWLGLSHRRLSIIDLSEGSQPMLSDDGNLALVFNGEIYNYIEVRDELRALGCEFRTHSDTEVLLVSYQKWGVECLKRFNGMFAFALLDIRKRKVFFARDRLGKKPLFYFQDARRFVFSSELPSLLKMVDAGDGDIDLSLISQFLQYQYVHSPNTIYKKIRRLEQGHCGELDLESGEFRNRSYWDFLPRIDTGISFEDAKARLRDLLYDAVKIRLRSDVPYSAFLSGGIDSSMICSIVAELAGGGFTAYTIGYENASFDESKFAAETARKLGIKHHFEIVRPDCFENVETIATCFGEPFADSSALPTYAVSRIAAQEYKVSITGDGGDEIFAGYNSYDYIRNGMDGSPPSSVMGLRIPEKIRNIVGKSGIFPGESYKTLHRQTMTLWSPETLNDVLRPEFMEGAGASFDSYLENPSDWLTDCQYCDLKTYLHNDILVKVDRMSMLNSLELRSPLLDYRIVEFAFSLPPEYKYAKLAGRWEKKRILKLLAEDVIGVEAVRRPKQGFGFPLHELMMNKGNPFEKLLGEYQSITEKFFKMDAIRAMLSARNDMGAATRLWYIYCFVAWYSRFIDA